MPEVYRLREDAPDEHLSAAGVWLEHHGVETRHVPPGAEITVGAREMTVEAYELDDEGGYMEVDGCRLVGLIRAPLLCQFPREAGEVLGVKREVAGHG